MTPHRSLAKLLAVSLLAAGPLLPVAAAPARAQELWQVQGFVANVTLRYRATFSNMLGSAPGFVTYNYRVRIANGSAQTDVTRNVEADTSLGRGLGSASQSFSGRIARPGQSNDGVFVWTFSNGTLTLLDTPLTAGFQLTVRFMDSGRGIVCNAAAPYVADASGAPSASQLAFGGQVMIVDMQQIESFCAVSTS